MKDKEQKKEYEAPVLTAVSFKVEQGFATSGLLSLFSSNPEWGDESIEDRQDGGNWHSSDGGWF